jgi:benzoylformate decarboxylase
MDTSTEASAAYTVRDATVALLRSLGMTTVFGNPGSTELAFFRDWPDDFRYILALQESCAVAMADGYAQSTRNAAFVNLHSAAGVGHALGSVFTSFRNQTPLVITAGQQTRAMQPTEPFLWATDAATFPKPYVKWSCEPARAQDVPAAIARAYYVAMQRPCGPTFVSIPADDWDAAAEPVAPRAVSFEFAPDPAALEQVADALNASERPALVVGAAVDQDSAWDAAVALAERVQAAVWVSPKASRSSFPEDHPLFAGFLPPVRQLVREKLADHDVVVVLGAPVFTYHVHTEGPFVPEGTRLYQMTDDPQAAAWAPVGSSVVATMRLGITQLLELVRPTRRPALGRLRAQPCEVEASDPISGPFVMQAIARTMPPDAIVVMEAPSHENDVHAYLPIRRSGSFYTSASGGLGYGLPAATGIALADPTRRVIAVLGDGSCMYAIQGLWSAVQHRLPVTFVVLHNQEYAALKAFSQMFNVGGFTGVDLPGIDIATLAKGYRCPSQRIKRAGDLPAALSASFASDGPMVLDVMVGSDNSPLF